MSIGDKLLKSAAAGGLTPSENFKTVLYTGNGGTQAITGVGFKPDFVWCKTRSTTSDHNASDSTRGVSQGLNPNTTAAEGNQSPLGVTAFGTDGFTVVDNSGGGAGVNGSGITYVAWCWKANGGTTSSNGVGSITSTVQANTDAGFSIVKYTGNGTAGATVGHGLGAVPSVLIVKMRTDAGNNWRVYHKYTDASSPEDYNLVLNSTAARYDRTEWNDTAPTSSVFSVSDHSSVNTNTKEYICYAFTDIEGFSKFGSYTGNGSDNGPIVETGFEVGYLMIKNTSSTESGGASWLIYDNVRSTTNPRDRRLYADQNYAEAQNDNYDLDFLSNGFQIKSGTSNYGFNNNGDTYIYMAFATDPDTEAPTLASSFNIETWTGTGSARSITGLGFSPNFLWIKQRSGTEQHYAYDTIRGYSKYLHTNLTNAEGTDTSSRLASFDSDGFSLFTDAAVNGSGSTYVAWAWKANDDVPTINDNGSIDSLVSANANAGFSIIKYTGTGSNLTVGHGLSSAPTFIIVKNLTSSSAWAVFHTTLGATKYLALNETTAEATASNVWNDTAPTATTISVGTWGPVNTSANQHIAYCFHDVTGYSKFGTYSGSGSDGNAVSLGFQPDFVMIKRTNDTGGWLMFDSARNTSNPRNNRLEADNNSAATTGSATKNVDFNATDFEANGSDTEVNASGSTYIYMAFKMNPTQYPVSAGKMAFLVIAGGGGGGANVGAGGGAGGLRTSYGLTSGGGSDAESNITLAAGVYTITVGAGGSLTGRFDGYNSGGQGSDSSIAASGLTTITSSGGGWGDVGGNEQGSGNAGGSGGGASSYNGGSHTGGAGTANQGYAGGSITGSSSNWGGSGGGGAGGVGSQGNPGTIYADDTGGKGGDGLGVAITGAIISYAGGGNGTLDTTQPTGGGGYHGTSASETGQRDGTANLGAGGRGGANAGNAHQEYGAGGSGVVILRMKTSDYSGTTSGSPTVIVQGDETILKFTGSGTYTHS